MICTSVMPCLSSELAKNNKIMSMFVLFYCFFANLKVSKIGGQTLHQSSQAVCF